MKVKSQSNHYRKLGQGQVTNWPHIVKQVYPFATLPPIWAWKYNSLIFTITAIYLVTSLHESGEAQSEEPCSVPKEIPRAALSEDLLAGTNHVGPWCSSAHHGGFDDIQRCGCCCCKSTAHCTHGKILLQGDRSISLCECRDSPKSIYHSFLIRTFG